MFTVFEVNIISTALTCNKLLCFSHLLKINKPRWAVEQPSFNGTPFNFLNETNIPSQPAN